MSRAKKRGPGRPVLPKGQVKGAMFCIRLTSAERHEVEQAATRAGQKASEWARGLLIRASKENA
jgi:hypothetical protein